MHEERNSHVVNQALILELPQEVLLFVVLVSCVGGYPHVPWIVICKWQDLTFDFNFVNLEKVGLNFHISEIPTQTEFEFVWAVHPRVSEIV